MISIIVPVYNATSSLAKCVDAILLQSFTDYELLLIDDGSTDDSCDICNRYAMLDSRVKVVHKINEGVSSARNKGLNEANGEYITFIDSDDVIKQGYLANLCAQLDADLTLCGFHSTEGINYKPDEKYVKNEEFANTIPMFVNHAYMLYAPWAKLYRRSIIEENHIRFDTRLRLFEDTIFILTYLSHCKSLRTIDSNLYYYVGVWGGGMKYRLSKEEVEYRCKKEYDCLSILEKQFDCNIDRKNRCYCIQYIENLFSVTNDEYCFELYRKYHKDTTRAFFFANPGLNPIAFEISRIKRLFADRKYSNGWQSLQALSLFITQADGEKSIYRIDERVVYRLLLKRYPTIAFLLLYFYSLFMK